MRAHWHNTERNPHFEFMERARFNIGKMFRPPKSKSPWQAMTLGSSRGWARGVEPWGPAINAALGMIPVVGPALSIGGGLIGMAGRGTGFQGTDKGFGGNILPMLSGGLMGYGLGGIGAGIGSGLKGLTGGTGFLSGAKAGMGGYFGTNIIPGMGGSNPVSWFGGANAIPTKTGSMMQPLYGGAPAVTGAGITGAGATGAGTATAGA